MLRLPNKGLGVSSRKHNNDLMVLCDWVETSAMVLDQRVSKASLADVLLEEQIYTDSDLCVSRLEDVWAELERRQFLLGGASTLKLRSAAISPTKHWQEAPALTFCLVCSLSPQFSEWSTTFGRTYTQQGGLFEKICEESMRQQLQGFEVKRTGWSATNTAGLTKVVRELASFLGDDVGDLTKWAPKKGKEAGVDLAWALPMSDGLAGPRFFAQCASGADWRQKRTQPDLDTWRKYIDFVNVPQRVMMTPFALTADEFVRMSPPVNGVIIERYRLLGTGLSEFDWVSSELRGELVQWLSSRVSWLKASTLSLTPA